MSEEVMVVLATCEGRDDAERLARKLVEARLAACVSIGAPVLSTYRWQGQVEQAGEVPLTIKTTAGQLEALKKVFEDEHPYDVPELLALPVSKGSESYMNWVREETRSDSE
ncbi:MAG: divalent-cation tolerance protein CutA [Pseudomonadota bacterium]